MLSNFATLNQLTEVMQRNVYVGVLYHDMISCDFSMMIVLVYNIARRGLTALLILELGQCEGLRAGMGESRNSHAFFISTLHIIVL